MVIPIRPAILTEEGWLAQQAQYDLSHVRRDRLTLKRLAVA